MRQGESTSLKDTERLAECKANGPRMLGCLIGAELLVGFAGGQQGQQTVEAVLAGDLR
jgi:hypothetical protein